MSFLIPIFCKFVLVIRQKRQKSPRETIIVSLFSYIHANKRSWYIYGASKFYVFFITCARSHDSVMVISYKGSEHKTRKKTETAVMYAISKPSPISKQFLRNWWRHLRFLLNHFLNAISSGHAMLITTQRNSWISWIVLFKTQTSERLYCLALCKLLVVKKKQTKDNKLQDIQHSAFCLPRLNGFRKTSIREIMQNLENHVISLNIAAISRNKTIAIVYELACSTSQVGLLQQLLLQDASSYAEKKPTMKRQFSCHALIFYEHHGMQ